MKKLELNRALSVLEKVTNRKHSIYPSELIRKSNYYGKYKILEYVKSEIHRDSCGKRITNHFFKIRFIKTGYESVVNLKSINSGSVKDMLYPNVHGVGYLGEDYNKIKETDSELFYCLYNRWYNIINRCYNPEHKSYKDYGGKGVTVCDRWHNFSKFYKDLQKLENYDRERVMSNDLTLDKDSKQVGSINKCYSPETCIWLTRKQQQSYIDHVGKTKNQWVKFRWEDPEGNTGTSTGLAIFAKEHNLNPSHIGDCIKGRCKSHKGWKFYPCE